jgi:hypothetical protein
MALESDHLEFDYIGVFHDLQDIGRGGLSVPCGQRPPPGGMLADDPEIRKFPATPP